MLARIYEIPRGEFAARRERLVDLFDLGPHGPRLVFLDEPTIGLDIVARRTMRDLIRRLNREDGVTVFLTSHDVADVERLCRRVIIINHGQVIYDDSLNALKREYHRAKYLDLLLDSPAGDFSCPGVKVVKVKGYGVKLAVDTSKVQLEDVLSRILSRCHVLDINIEDPPLEEVIAEIYGEGSLEEGP